MKIKIKYSHVTFFDIEKDTSTKKIFIGGWKKIREVKGLEGGYPVKVLNKTLELDINLGEVTDLHKVIFDALENNNILYDGVVWC